MLGGAQEPKYSLLGVCVGEEEDDSGPAQPKTEQDEPVEGEKVLKVQGSRRPVGLRPPVADLRPRRVAGTGGTELSDRNGTMGVSWDGFPRKRRPDLFSRAPGQSWRDVFRERWPEMAAWAALLLLGLLWTTTAHKNHGHNHVKHIRLGHRIRMAASYLAQSCSEHGRFRYIARANGMEHPEAGQYDMVRHAWVVSTLAQYALYEPSLDSHASRAADDRPAEVEAPLLRSTNLLIKSLHPGANASVAAPGRLLGALALWAPIDPAAEAARAEAARAEAEARAPARSTLRDVDSRVLPGPARMVAPQRTAHGRARAAFVREKLRSALAGERARALRAAAGPTPAHPPPPLPPVQSGHVSSIPSY
jgi:hypothetical protein